jgi:hypothetical protein
MDRKFPAYCNICDKNYTAEIKDILIVPEDIMIMSSGINVNAVHSDCLKKEKSKNKKGKLDYVR